MDNFKDKLFILMGCTIFLLNSAFSVLRSFRNTLAIADLCKTAQVIPYFELLGVLPASILMTWWLARLLNRHTIQKVFFRMLGFFLGFFLVFSCLLYPLLAFWHKNQLESHALSLPSIRLLSVSFSLLFYIMAELWKPALINILFWGLINQSISPSSAKSQYAPLLLASSLGSLASGPIVLFCTSEASWKIMPLAKEQWMHSLALMAFILLLHGILIGWLFSCLSRRLERHFFSQSNTSFSLGESLKLCFSSKPLFFLSILVLADYLAYSFGEVIFLELLKEKFPDPCAYCLFMGKLTFWSSLLTLLFALGVAPPLLRKGAWTAAALALPLSLLLIEGAFFLLLSCKSIALQQLDLTTAGWLSLTVILGSTKYVFGRAIKYTLFDASKEIAFVILPQSLKLKGKLVIDGICARLGRGSSSAASLLLISLMGGVLASATLAGIATLLILFCWIGAAQKLGSLIERDKEGSYV